MKSLSISTGEKLNIISSLTTYLSAGIPILEAVDSLIEEAKGNSLKILSFLKEDLNQGKTIAYSLARHPKSFDPIGVNLIKAAEEAGTLESTLKDLTQSIKKDIDFTGRVKSSLVYPALVVVILLMVIVLNLFFVIPRISKVFENLKIQLPLATKILIATSNIANDYFIFVILAIVLIVTLIVITFKTKKNIIANFASSMPVISKLIRFIDLARFNRSMSLLLKSGIPIDESIELAADVTSKTEIKTALVSSLQGVSSGKTFSSQLKKHQSVFPSFMIRIIQAGEKSGTLEKSMQDISEEFQSRVEDRIKILTTLIEPVLLLIVGLLVGGIMLAIIAPIYNLIGNISQR